MFLHAIKAGKLVREVEHLELKRDACARSAFCYPQSLTWGAARRERELDGEGRGEPATENEATDEDAREVAGEEAEHPPRFRIQQLLAVEDGSSDGGQHIHVAVVRRVRTGSPCPRRAADEA